MDFSFIITAQEALSDGVMTKQDEETNRQHKIKEILELRELFEAINAARIIPEKCSIPLDRKLSLFQENFMKFLGYEFAEEEVWSTIPCDYTPNQCVPVMHYVDVIQWKEFHKVKPSAEH